VDLIVNLLIRKKLTKLGSNKLPLFKDVVVND